MSEELKNLLLTYLGELTYDLQNCHDWIEQDSLKGKINAINVLLGTEYREKSFFE